ncbi:MULTISPECIES: hypothetical protein [Saccharibacillus]|uniref:Uncharacterized protein n=1 Tax=Saccharibacillus brassicae TaxID=2583377 RepID=A0A4Y6UTJ3_SACBS|nr:MULTISPECIES: hypothetical protein [Saccharibacillus]MWJ32040.1 hypothetical protein [Saccharibacillus sp. WB 17]QDH19671.1 hypothetical protein FFV09_01610 [Saccharibacillus brassicae]
MEQSPRDQAVRQGAEALAGTLHFFSLGMGVVLIAFGLYVIWPKKYDRKRSGTKTFGGVLCAGFGLVLLVNGLLQL